MKYIALIYSDPQTSPAPGTENFGKMMDGYKNANKTYHGDGVYVTGDALQPPAQPRPSGCATARRRPCDGPFAETKEQLGGFYILDCANLDDAMRYAALIPHAANGAVEVRPIMVFDR